MKKGLITKALIAAGIAGIIAIAVKEYPAVQREIKIWKM